MIDMIRQLYAHMRWADSRTLDAMRAAHGEVAAHGAATQSKALRVLAHIAGAENVWLSRLQHRNADHAVWPDLSIDQCAAALAANAEGYDALLRSLDDAGLESEVSYTNSAGQHFVSKISDILMHAAMHGSYHRGQVAMMLRESGAEPAATDFIAFVRGAPAATTAVISSGVIQS